MKPSSPHPGKRTTVQLLPAGAARAWLPGANRSPGKNAALTSDWDYWGKPVPAFGDPDARLLVVGLAPGAHGSNRTGRMFTGDASGEFLFAALFRAGFANQPHGSQMEDGLTLKDMLITAVCRCVPPNNKPTSQEMLACRPFLLAEMAPITPYPGHRLPGPHRF